MDQPYLAWMDRDAVDARVKSIDQAELGYDDCEARYLLGDQPFTGFSAIRYADGTLSSLAEYRDGIEEGVSVAWYPGGQIEVFAQMAESVYHGIVAKWDEKGTRIGVSHYNRGLEVESNSASPKPRPTS